jgi:hypothetical protein
VLVWADAATLPSMPMMLTVYEAALWSVTSTP